MCVSYILHVSGRCIVLYINNVQHLSWIKQTPVRHIISWYCRLWNIIIGLLFRFYLGKELLFGEKSGGRTVFRTIGGIKSHKKQKIDTYSLGSKAWDTLPKSVISNRAQSCWNSEWPDRSFGLKRNWFCWI